MWGLCSLFFWEDTWSCYPVKLNFVCSLKSSCLCIHSVVSVQTYCHLGAYMIWDSTLCVYGRTLFYCE